MEPLSDEVRRIIIIGLVGCARFAYARSELLQNRLQASAGAEAAAAAIGNGAAIAPDAMKRRHCWKDWSAKAVESGEGRRID